MADEDGWVGLTWNSPLMYDRNFATAGFDRPHVFQMGFVYTLPFMQDRTDVVGAPRAGLAVERHHLRLLRHAVHGHGHQHGAQLPGLRLDHRQLHRRRLADR